MRWYKDANEDVDFEQEEFEDAELQEAYDRGFSAGYKLGLSESEELDEFKMPSIDPAAVYNSIKRVVGKGLESTICKTIFELVTNNKFVAADLADEVSKKGAKSAEDAVEYFKRSNSGKYFDLLLKGISSENKIEKGFGEVLTSAGFKDKEVKALADDNSHKFMDRAIDAVSQKLNTPKFWEKLMNNRRFYNNLQAAF